jgi:hypothetical protein
MHIAIDGREGICCYVLCVSVVMLAHEVQYITMKELLEFFQHMKIFEDNR